MMREAGGKKNGNARIRQRCAASLGGRIGGAALFPIHVVISPGLNAPRALRFCARPIQTAANCTLGYQQTELKKYLAE
jgi:hypothetical protein